MQKKINQDEIIKRKNGFIDQKNILLDLDHNNKENNNKEKNKHYHHVSEFLDKSMTNIKHMKSKTQKIVNIGNSQQYQQYEGKSNHCNFMRQTKQQQKHSQFLKIPNLQSQSKPQFQCQFQPQPHSSFKPHHSTKKLKRQNYHPKKSFNFLDLKLKNIQDIVNKVQWSNHSNNFQKQNQKQQKQIKKNGWYSVYNVLTKRSQEQNQKFIRQVNEIRHTIASQHNNRKQMREKQFKKLFCQNKNNKNKRYCISLNNSIIQKPHHQNPLTSPPKPQTHSPTPNQQLKQNKKYKSKKIQQQYQHNQNKTIFWQQFNQTSLNNFLTLTNPLHHEPNFNGKTSLKLFNQQKSDFYVVKNLEQLVKQDPRYQQITIQNLKKYQKTGIISFVYLNQNSYRMQSKKYNKVFEQYDVVV